MAGDLFPDRQRRDTGLGLAVLSENLVRIRSCVVENRMPEPEPAPADGADPPALAAPTQSRATILPSQSTDHCTPPVVAEGVVYPVLGDPVDLDPCSNENSIIRAHRRVMLPEDGLAIDWYGKIFCNPPYGSPEIEKWIAKCIVSNRLNGAEIIALLPANVSSEWFDMLVATSQAVFFWGPGDGNRRIQHIGTKFTAAFASVLVYWGPNLVTFARHAIRYCHPWFPQYDLRLMRAMLADAAGSGDALAAMAVADELLVQGRHDTLASALVCLGDVRLGEIIDYGDTAMLHHLRALSAYELAAALVCASRPGTHWMERRLPKTMPPCDPRQINLQFQETRSAGLARDRGGESLEDLTYRLIGQAKDGLAISALMELTGEPRGKLRTALGRLRKAKIVIKKGTTKDAAYSAAREEGQT